MTPRPHVHCHTDAGNQEVPEPPAKGVTLSLPKGHREPSKATWRRGRHSEQSEESQTSARKPRTPIRHARAGGHPGAAGYQARNRRQQGQLCRILQKLHNITANCGKSYVAVTHSMVRCAVSLPKSGRHWASQQRSVSPST